MNRHSSFFKIILFPISSEQLLIPVAYVRHMKGALPVHALLRNHHGKLWQVTIDRVGNEFFFKQGWAKFLIDNNVESRDILVFDYDGARLFATKIYGKTACEKEVNGSEGIKLVVEEEEELKMEEIEEEENNCDGDKVEGNETDEETEEYTGEGEEEEEDEVEVEYTEEDKLGKGLKMVNISTNDNYKGKAVVEAEGVWKNENPSKGSEFVTISPKVVAKFERDFSDAAEEVDEVFKYGIVSCPKNPYFVTRLRATRTNELYVPVDVIRDHNLKLPPKIILLDEEHRKWTAKVKPWKDGRTWLTDGWRAFRKWNNLEWDDRCLCEFMNTRSGGEIYLKMTILRAGSWLPKADR